MRTSARRRLKRWLMVTLTEILRAMLAHAVSALLSHIL